MFKYLDSLPHMQRVSPYRTRVLFTESKSWPWFCYYTRLPSLHNLTMSDKAPKRQRSSKDVPFHLVYWPGIPGRGEHVRLALEEAGADYTDTAHAKDGLKEVLSYVQAKKACDDTNVPVLAPPILEHGDLVISQTPNILLYLGPRLGLVPSADEDEDGIYRVNSLALTALDGLSNEVHDCHHPVATGAYYEDQKEESMRKAADYVKNRLPRFLGYFQRVLQSTASGDGPWLYGGQLSYADLVLYQVCRFMSFKVNCNARSALIPNLSSAWTAPNTNSQKQ